jgi:hypothetical protein
MPKYLYVEARGDKPSSFRYVYITAATEDDAYVLGQNDCDRIEAALQAETLDDPEGVLTDHFYLEFNNDMVVALDGVFPGV